MAYSEDNQTPVSVDNKDKHRNSADLLPLYFRTEANKKFLGATLDSLISKGNLENIAIPIHDAHALIAKENMRANNL